MLKTTIYCRLFEFFVSILDLLVQNARIEGNLDSGIVDMKANIVELQGTPKVNSNSRSVVGFTLFIILTSNCSADCSC